MSIQDMRANITAPVEDMIGVSTISFGGIRDEQVDQAIGAIAQGGFKTIEVFMNVGDMSAIGHPEPLPGPWLYPERVDKTRRRQVREKLKDFSYTTAHVQMRDCNIASSNPGIRAESIRQYIECIELARDLGIPLITFHCGRFSREGYPNVGVEQTIKYNREFVERALPFAEKYDIYMGFECLGPECMDLVDIAKSSGKEHFGVHIDVMWTTSAVGRDGLLKVIEQSKDLIVEVHVHGGMHGSMGVKSHLPLRMNNMVAFEEVMPRIRETGFKGPFIFEITSSEDIRAVVQDCRHSKELLLDYLHGGADA